MEFPTIKPDNKSSKKKKYVKVNKFKTFDLSEPVYRGIMKLGFKKPTPIQEKAIPVAMDGKDVVAMARTGSGKSAAFLIPMIDKLKSHSSIQGSRGVIVSPTRELTHQLYLVCLQLCKFTTLKVCLLQGGDKIEAQFEALQNFPDILICTPGRLAHLLLEMNKDLSLSRVEYLVFDEADRLFEMGFRPQVELILNRCPDTRQTLLFSATLPSQLIEFANAGLKRPKLIRLDTDASLSANLSLAFFKVRTQEKLSCLLYLLDEIIPESESTVVFVATRYHVEYLQRVLKLTSKLKIAVAYGSLDQESRQENLEKFRNGEAKILIVTDVASRGLDIPLLNNVINYDFPANKPVKLFIHRVGRAARQERAGVAVSFLTAEEVPYLIEVSTFIGIKVDEKCTKEYNWQELNPKAVNFGIFPQEIVDEYGERVNRARQEDSDLQSLEKSLNNANNLYKRSRENASRAAVRKSKLLNVTHIHPLLQAKVKKNDYLADLSTQLRAFKPKETIFEVNDKKLKQSSLTQSSAILKLKQKFNTLKDIKKQVNEELEKSTGVTSNEAEKEVTTPGRSLKEIRSELVGKASKRKAPLSKADRKRLKKGVSRAVIEKEREQKSSKPEQKSYRAAEYISVELDDKRDAFKNEKVALENESLELIPDDQKAMQKKIKSYKWDKKKKKYIKASIEEHIKSKRVRNEAGKVISIKERGNLYQKWQRNAKRAFNSNVENTQDSVVNVKHISKNLRLKKTMDKIDVKDEVLSKEQIAKKQKEKYRMKKLNVRGHKKIVRKEKQQKKRELIEKRVSRNKKIPQPSRHRRAKSRIMG